MAENQGNETGKGVKRQRRQFSAVEKRRDQIFKNPMTTAAAIDRLVHHSVILEFNGPSIRAEEAKKRNPKTPPQPSP